LEKSRLKFFTKIKRTLKEEEEEEDDDDDAQNADDDDLSATAAVFAAFCASFRREDSLFGDL
jgi:hypothetical protein